MVEYETSNDNYVNNSRNRVKIIGLKKGDTQILDVDEVSIADKKEIRNYNIAGFAFIALGGLSYYLRKRKTKSLHTQ